jgi:7-cyano-7-deazaguanine synthase
MAKAILLSGGIDSVSLAHWEKPDYAITINYGQRPALAEVRASKAVCEALAIRHIVIEADCSTLGSGDLANEKALEIAPSTEWWPYRNQLLVTLACMKSISFGVSEMMIASVKSDGFHKDGTEEFYSLLNNLMAFQEGNIAISAPAIHLSSIELVIHSGIPSETLYYAHSCHTSSVPCGRCGGCYKYISVMQTLKDGGWQKS